MPDKHRDRQPKRETSARAAVDRSAIDGKLFPRPVPPGKVASGHGEIADRRGGIDFNEEAPKHGGKGIVSLSHSQPICVDRLSRKGVVFA